MAHLGPRPAPSAAAPSPPTPTSAAAAAPRGPEHREGGRRWCRLGPGAGDGRKVAGGMEKKMEKWGKSWKHGKKMVNDGET